MAHAKAGVQLAVGDVSVLALVEVGQAVEEEALEVPYEVGGHHGDEAPLGHDARLDVVELQTCVGTSHLACHFEKIKNEKLNFSKAKIFARVLSSLLFLPFLMLDSVKFKNYQYKLKA